MNKEYKLIISHENSFSLSNETDADIQSDYNPGIWCIKTQKKALQYARELLAQGHTIRVTDYDNPKYHKLANMFISELNLPQALFVEAQGIPQSTVTNDKPRTLGALKTYLKPGTKIKIINTEHPDRTRETEVVKVQSNAITTKKGNGESWLYFEKASNWCFDNTGATYYYLTREGEQKPSYRIEY